MNVSRNSSILIHENAFKNVCEKATNLVWPQYVIIYHWICAFEGNRNMTKYVKCIYTAPTRPKSKIVANCSQQIVHDTKSSNHLIARFMGPTLGPSGADRTQVGPMLAPWTLLSGSLLSVEPWICQNKEFLSCLFTFCIIVWTRY